MKGQTFLSTLAGVLVGAVLVVGGQRFTSARSSDESPTPNDPAAASRAQEITRTTIQVMGPQPPPASTSSENSESMTPPSAPPPTEEEVAENYQKLLDDHDQDPKDPVWAPQTQQSFARDLDSIGNDTGFTVTSVDCRTTSCTARLNWDDYATASSGYKQVLTGHMEPDCTRSILVRHADGDGPYETVAHFDCTESR